MENSEIKTVSRKEWGSIPTVEAFLLKVKEQAITNARLKKVLFGDTAIKLIRCLKNDTQEGYDILRRSGAIWYMATVALEEASKLESEVTNG